MSFAVDEVVRAPTGQKVLSFGGRYGNLETTSSMVGHMVLDERRGAPAQHEPVPEELMERVVARFRALSDANRLRLLELIVSGERSVNDLAEAAGLTQANTSKHLQVLCSVGFINRRKEGTRIFYALANDTPQVLCDIVCSEVRDQLRRELASLQ
ncbi:MAG: ArsR family transcriptional regulator [Deltaproteobacteria bacterium]|nr:MAG: ArsR family transcriptional regulator [Deltaproteobacteria bacterium]